MPSHDILLLTDARFENPADPDWYVNQILTEDRILSEALEKRGLRAKRVDWARKDFDWSAARCAVFRTTWNYSHRFAEFSAWLERTARQPSSSTRRN